MTGLIFMQVSLTVANVQLTKLLRTALSSKYTYE